MFHSWFLYKVLVGTHLILILIHIKTSMYLEQACFRSAGYNRIESAFRLFIRSPNSEAGFEEFEIKKTLFVEGYFLHLVVNLERWYEKREKIHKKPKKIRESTKCWYWAVKRCK